MVNFNGAAKERLGGIVAALLQPQITEITDGTRIIGAQTDRQLIMPDSFGGRAGILIGQRQIEMGLGKFRPAAERLAITIRCFGKLSRRAHQHAEIVERIREIRREIGGLAEGRRGIVQTTGGAVSLAQIVADLGVGIAAMVARALKANNRLRHPAGAEMFYG